MENKRWEKKKTIRKLPAQLKVAGHYYFFFFCSLFSLLFRRHSTHIVHLCAFACFLDISRVFVALSHISYVRVHASASLHRHMIKCMAKMWESIWFKTPFFPNFCACVRWWWRDCCDNDDIFLIITPYTHDSCVNVFISFLCKTNEWIIGLTTVSHFFFSSIHYLLPRDANIHVCVCACILIFTSSFAMLVTIFIFSHFLFSKKWFRVTLLFSHQMIYFFSFSQNIYKSDWNASKVMRRERER